MGQGRRSGQSGVRGPSRNPPLSRRTYMTRSLFTAAFATLFAALVPFAVQAQTSPTPSYVDVSGYALPHAQYEAWINLRIELKRDFDQFCRDTVCEGDFTNIEPLRCSCSV